ncbi:MAG: hypothetical protein JW963_22565 [Anaerolineales bacterium]|nr:hypothetical protein [Anaerolineales bacterium]
MEKALIGKGQVGLQLVKFEKREVWRDTGDCIAQSMGRERILCVETTRNTFGVMRVVVYPDEVNIAAVDENVLNGLLSNLVMGRFARELGVEMNVVTVGGAASEPVLRW